jgi:hypothetical protein
VYRYLHEKLGARSAQVLFCLWYALLIVALFLCFGQTSADFYYLRH